jgi:hypothetical protein
LESAGQTAAMSVASNDASGQAQLALQEAGSSKEFFVFGPLFVHQNLPALTTLGGSKVQLHL